MGGFVEIMRVPDELMPARGKLPPLGVGTQVPFPSPAAEYDRVAREASLAGVRITKARPVQQRLLVRLAERAPERRLRAVDAAVIDRFLAAATDETLDDAALVAAWRAAGGVPW